MKTVQRITFASLAALACLSGHAADTPPVGPNTSDLRTRIP